MDIYEAWNLLWRLGEDCASGNRDVTVLPKIIKQESTEHLHRVIEAWNLCWTVEDEDDAPLNDAMQMYFLAARRELRKRERFQQSMRQAEKKVKRSYSSEPIPGYVYLLQSASGHFKIGRTINPQNRLRTFGVQLPFEVEYVCLIEADDMHRFEKTLHEMFTDKRVNGEWFALESADVEYIKGLQR